MPEGRQKEIFCHRFGATLAAGNEFVSPTEIFPSADDEDEVVPQVSASTTPPSTCLSSVPSSPTEIPYPSISTSPTESSSSKNTDKDHYEEDDIPQWIGYQTRSTVALSEVDAADECYESDMGEASYTSDSDADLRDERKLIQELIYPV